jgi:hypothetical protein
MVPPVFLMPLVMMMRVVMMVVVVVDVDILLRVLGFGGGEGRVVGRLLAGSGGPTRGGAWDLEKKGSASSAPKRAKQPTTRLPSICRNYSSNLQSTGWTNHIVRSRGEEESTKKWRN